MRVPISPEEQLAVTLRFMATGDTHTHRGLRHIDIGTKISGPFLPSPLEIGKDEKKFRSDCLQAYQITANYLKSMLPINSFIKNSAYISPEKRNDNGSLEVISDLAKMVSSALPNVLTAAFPKSDLTSEEVLHLEDRIEAVSNRTFSRDSLSNDC